MNIEQHQQLKTSFKYFFTDLKI